MRTSKPRQRAAPINLALQDLHVRSRFPDFVCHRGRRGYVWRGQFQPRALSPVYDVEVRCTIGHVPEVRVLSPPLACNAPHLYRGGKLCLYWPPEWRWRESELIAETILPWTASWLYFYELWQDTGEWLGPSSHGTPTPKADERHAA